MREIVVNATPEETRVVVLENGKPVEVVVERAEDRSLVGNVYLGRVDRVLPGMQSAFVDLGLERHAFLHVSDVLGPDAEREGPLELRTEPAPDDVAEDAAAAPPAEAEGAGAGPARKERRGEPRIEDLLRAGQEILVQVTREPMGTKGARVTTHVTLPGKLVVYMPTSEHLGISKRITDEPAREALRALVEGLRGELQGGAIVRTDAAAHPPEAVEAELRALRDRWAALRGAVAGRKAPALVHEEPGIAVRAVRDALAAEVSRIVVDDEAVHAAIVAFAESHAPRLAPLVQRHPAGPALFEALGLEAEIDKALRGRAWLKSGGYLVIDQLEALVAIDVNTGKFTGSRRLEDTVLQTNVEAAREVARQLRLRDLGGIVVVDFIDMAEPEHRRQVMAELEQALAKDRARTTVLGMSEFGLVQLTRQRQKRSLDKTLLEACPSCSGTGRVKSVATLANGILRRLRALAPPPGHVVKLTAHPSVAERIAARQEASRGTPQALPFRVEVVADPARARDAYDLTT